MDVELTPLNSKNSGSYQNANLPDLHQQKCSEESKSSSIMSTKATSLTLLTVLLLATIGIIVVMFSGSDREKIDFLAVKQEIINLIKSDADLNKGPTLVRLSWHSSGTYSRITQTGGSGKGTIRFQEELAHGANAGLQQAVDWLEPIYTKYQGLGQDLSHADLYTLAGVVAIETLKGPKIPWRAGRVDTLDPSDVTPDGRLPSANKGTPEKT
jgi:catalase (peroxidase I)